MSRAKQAAAKGVSYADAGVDISAGNALVEAIKPLAKSTRRKGADSALGGFGGLFDLNLNAHRSASGWRWNLLQGGDCQH